MKLTDVLVELARKGVSEEVIENVIPAFRAMEVMKKRNDYTAKWARKERAKKAAALRQEKADRPRQVRANGTA